MVVNEIWRNRHRKSVTFVPYVVVTIPSFFLLHDISPDLKTRVTQYMDNIQEIGDPYAISVY